MALKKLLLQIVLIVFLSIIIGLGINFSLIEKYFMRDFRFGFISLEKYTSVTFITLEEAEWLFSEEEALFIDSRPKAAFQAGHIMGAVNIPYEEYKREEALDLIFLPPEGTVVIYCDGSECNSSVELAKVLHQKGLLDIRIFFGGWVEWKKGGLPVSSENDPQ
jgi:rhodanese-related sulfurtransferase